ncbi:unnamed protein product [Amoebophrya sp. A120]|nr:unnamed protein product [Amoebophrya sp. A120]|eukprot:GSA120T00016801001.1
MPSVLDLALLWEQGSFATGGTHTQSVTLANLFPCFGWGSWCPICSPSVPLAGRGRGSSSSITKCNQLRRSEDELQVRLYDRNEAILSSAIDLSGSSGKMQLAVMRNLRDADRPEAALACRQWHHRSSLRGGSSVPIRHEKFKFLIILKARTGLRFTSLSMVDWRFFCGLKKCASQVSFHRSRRPDMFAIGRDGWKTISCHNNDEHGKIIQNSGTGMTSWTVHGSQSATSSANVSGVSSESKLGLVLCHAARKMNSESEPEPDFVLHD